MTALGAQDGLQPPRLRRGYQMGGPLQADQRTYVRIREIKRTLRGKETVIKIQPANSGTDVECPAYGVELVISSGNPGAWVCLVNVFENE